MKTKTKREDCSNFACFRGMVEVHNAVTPEGDPVTEICPICGGQGWIEVPDKEASDVKP